MKLVVLLLPSLLLADGGQIILRQRIGPDLITVFAAPTPVRAGQPADISVLVQRETDRSVLLEGEADLRFSRPAQPDVNARAIHSLATNKLLFAANVILPSEGTWTLTVGYGESSARGNVNVLVAEPDAWAYWPYFAAIPVAIALFLLNRRLQEARQSG